MESTTIRQNVAELATEFGAHRYERQIRRTLEQADFDRLRDAGVHLTGVLAEHGGIWKDVARSTRGICEILRTLAQGDSSVALVCTMHPAVLSFWMATPQVTPDAQQAWDAQRTSLSQSAAAGAWWGTITSEPASGGDIYQTKTMAQPDSQPLAYRLTGTKHFGSGSGITSFMITTALPVNEQEPDYFYLDMRGVPWDGSQGVTLTAPWDGHGMIATQSHGMRFENYPATRCAWQGNIRKVGEGANAFITCAFSAVIVGIVQVALATARQQLERRYATLKPFEQIEWTRAELDGWLIEQAYEGILRAIEAKGSAARRDALLGKTAIAEHAESCLGRLCKVIGGGAYARRSPFGFWFEDVRALGFLRPPWVLAYDQLYATQAPPA